MIVVDASALLEVLLATPVAPTVEDRLFAEGESLHVPHLLDLEIAQVLRRYALNRYIDASRAQQALTDLDDFPLNRYPHNIFLTRVWELRDNLTAYDAVYVALAEALRAPLITRDNRLTATPNVATTIEVV